MRRIPLVTYFFLASAFLSAQQTKPVGFRITGLAVNARDSSPVRRGHVTASPVAAGRSGSREPLRTDTDETGHFLLELPMAGDWQINISAHNIRSQNFEDHDGYFSGVVLTPSEPTYDMVFHAIPDAILAGTVTDEAGEPVRSAQVGLYVNNRLAQQTGTPPLQQRESAQTDDRGHYEFASLEAGTYLVQVQARPWYAANFAPPRTNAADSSAAQPDSSLDVVYPTTWYPSATDVLNAGTLIAHPGDSLQADIRLVPIASAHLLIPSLNGPQPTTPVRLDQNGVNVDPPRPFRGNPSLTLITPDGTAQPVFGQFISRNAHGDLEIGGLPPGTYQITVPGDLESPPRRTTVQLTAGATSTEIGVTQQTTPVTISVDGDSRTRASQISLRSTRTGQVYPDFTAQDMRDRFSGNPAEPPPDGQRTRPGASQGRLQATPRSRPPGQAPGQSGRTRARNSLGPDESTFQVPPGSYEVSLPGNTNAYLTGVTAKGGSAVGRIVTITESPASIAVHLGTGFASVKGAVAIDDKPSVGAMVLLVPATLGDPASLTTVHRDQTNTDGSFHLDGVMPGPYILVAIDHGWSVRWTDPDTLRPYLLRGTPLELHPSTAATQKLTAIVP